MPSDDGYFSSQLNQGILCLTFTDPNLALDDVPDLKVELEQAVESIDPPRLVLSLENVGYLPTTALGVMMATLTRVRRQKGELRLACLCDHIAELMHIGRLDRVFDIHDTVEEAVTSMTG